MDITGSFFEMERKCTEFISFPKSEEIGVSNMIEQSCSMIPQKKGTKNED